MGNNSKILRIVYLQLNSKHLMPSLVTIIPAYRHPTKGFPSWASPATARFSTSSTIVLYCAAVICSNVSVCVLVCVCVCVCVSVCVSVCVC